MNFLHYGLYCSPMHVISSQENADQAPFADAWAYLRGHELTDDRAALWGGLRWRLLESERYAQMGVEVALRWIDPALLEGESLIDALDQTLMLAHAYELLRDFPGFSPPDQARWQAAFAERLTRLTQEESGRIHEEYSKWLLTLVGGIVLERSEWVDLAVAAFQRIVAEEISPRGYIERAVMGKDGGAMYRQLRAGAALALMAEAASHIGIDLWGYHVRGVSAMTTAVYPIYYFYTTAKWKWDADYPVEEVQALFRRHGGYLEMLARRLRSAGTTPSRDLTVLLTDLRPIFDASGGGLTTLTHAQPGQKKRRGLFG
jgi:hypothetical protein